MPTPNNLTPEQRREMAQRVLRLEEIDRVIARGQAVLALVRTQEKNGPQSTEIKSVSL